MFLVLRGLSCEGGGSLAHGFSVAILDQVGHISKSSILARMALKVKNLNFQGERLNFVQIGLGTNSTFIQNFAGERHEWDENVDWLMRASSEQRPEVLQGIAVEPVSELVAALKRPAEGLPHVELVQVAMGECDMWGTEVQVLSLHERDALLQRVPARRRASLQHDLEYILNMSSVGGVHPCVPGLIQNIAADYNIHIDMEERQCDVWTWNTLSWQCNFRGCEVLLIDTEGYDAQILRSIIDYCRYYPDAWPQVIQFETMGHCDEKEGSGTEWNVIKALEAEGYTLVNLGHNNSNLVLSSALQTEARIQDWVAGWTCDTCMRSWQLPYSTNRKGRYCRRCDQAEGSGSWQWSRKSWSCEAPGWDWSH